MQKFKGESLDNATARLLKQKGVPLVGTFNLKIAPGFVVTRTDYFDKHVFAWKKHDKQ